MTRQIRRGEAYVYDKRLGRLVRKAEDPTEETLAKHEQLVWNPPPTMIKELEEP